MDIKVLGTGCANCQTTTIIVREVVAEENIDAVVEHVTKIKEIAKYRVSLTPAVVIDGEIISSGKIPTKEEVRTWLTNKKG